MVYQCFRANCKARGIVDQEFLMRLGANNFDTIMALNKYNKSVAKQNGHGFSMKQAKQLVNVVNTRDSKSNEIKLNYINKRLGLNLSYKDIYKLKINLDFWHLLNFNEVKIPDKLQKLYKVYGMYGVTFISAYNDYAIVRDITNGKLKERYTNVNIFGAYEDVTKIYTIPRKIDLLSPETTVINVSEGAFDILGVYFHLDIDREYTNQIFAAACGAGLVNLIKHLIRQYALTNIKINVFSDNDVDIKNYYNLRSLDDYVDNLQISVYYNKIGKDFGVRKDQIDYSVTRL